MVSTTIVDRVMRAQLLLVAIAMLKGIANICVGADGKMLFRIMNEEESVARHQNITALKALLNDISNPKAGPGQQDLDEKKLKSLLGRLLDPNFHSIKKPPNLSKVFTEHITEQTLLESMSSKLLSDTFELPDTITKAKIHQKATKYLRLYLQNLAYCPLSYTWKDLGKAVWPRYFKETFCIAKPCSHPPGMTCQESVSKTISFLYWTCHVRVRKSGGESEGARDGEGK